GTKTIGLAISDAGQSIATPLRTIERKKFGDDLKQLGKVSREYEVGGFVFGWPLNMDGSISSSCDRVMSFIDEMKKYPQELGMDQGADLWIALFDERLSTVAVNDFLVNDVDMSRTKRGQVVDKLAAQLILQGALDFLALGRLSS
ncbi:MAG: Holliday junction resolvase RuvX, partial [Micavibrio aeruginosavorus]